MRAVRCCDGGVVLEDVPRPEGEGVRVRVRSAGICGSDLHMLAAKFPLTNTLGHEIAGELDDGTVVAIEPLTPCGECDRCLEQRYNLCRLGPSIMMGVQKDGGMADEIRVPERCLVPLAPEVAARDGSLVEPLAVALHGVREAGIQAGQRVAVIGAGSIGLCAVIAAQSVGADVSLAARHARQKEAGGRLGARVEIEGEFDVVIDCAGTADALNQAAVICRPGGTLVFLASYWEGMSLPGFAICLKEIRCIPSMMYSHHHGESDFVGAAAILAARSEIVDIMVTHRLPLDDAVRAFEIAANREAGAIKVLLEV